LAPSFFDAAVVARERENRAEQRRWLALWEPLLAKAYGVAPEPAVDRVEGPPLPPPATQRAVDRQLAEVQLWTEAAHAARERHQRRQPHALPSLTRLARLLQLAFDLKKVALGLDSKNPLPEKITYDYEFTDLKRAYGHLSESSSTAAGSERAIPITETDNKPGSALGQRPTPLSSDAKPTSLPNHPPPVDEKRDLTPHRLVIGSHGLLCLEPI
jgi:hypothetical protein